MGFAHDVAKRLFAGGLEKGHGYNYVVGQYLRGSNTRTIDMMQGAFGYPPLGDSEVLRRTVTMEDLRRAGAEYWRVHEGYAMPDLSPRVVPPSATGAIPLLKDAKARPIEVTRLRNVLVADFYGWLRVEDGRWVTDSYPSPSFHFMAHWEKMNLAAQEPARGFPGVTALLTSENSANYYHCLHQVIAQIDAIRQAVPRGIDRWLVRDAGPGYVKEILVKMGIDLATVVEAKGMPVRCEALIVGDIPSMGALKYDGDWPLGLIRDLFAPKESIVPHRRVYLRRGAKDTRPILNLDEVDATMASLGFETRTMEGLTIGEQARLMAETKTLVAPHGAALANIVFCAPGTAMVEMLPRLWPSPLYGMVSQTCGLRHAFVVGSEADLPFLGVRHGNAATKVPIFRLEEAIQTLEAEN